jgi:hypothetical protein
MSFLELELLDLRLKNIVPTECVKNPWHLIKFFLPSWAWIKPLDELECSNPFLRFPLAFLTVLVKLYLSNV